MIQFVLIELACCAFPIAIFLGLAVTSVIWGRVAMPVARYDALLIYVIVVQVAFVVLRLETWRELCVICAFHLIGLALEVFKVHAGSWSYPDAGAVRIAGVPVFSGFMYASVGSYICQAFRRFDLHVGKFGSWALLITLSFVLVAAVKAKEGVLYGAGAPRVTRDRLRPDETIR